jgi:hypothetical protein
LQGIQGFNCAGYVDTEMLRDFESSTAPTILEQGEDLLLLLGFEFPD